MTESMVRRGCHHAAESIGFRETGRRAADGIESTHRVRVGRDAVHHDIGSNEELLFEILPHYTDLRASHIHLISIGAEQPGDRVLNSATLRHREDGERCPHWNSEILTVAGSDGLIGDEGTSCGSRRRRLDHRILIPIIAFGLAMIFLVLAFIVLAREVAHTSENGPGAAELGKRATLTATPLMGSPVRHSWTGSS
ncbi:hypothetical protein [Nocardia amikacinitolerans]|uniref:hypothetical protein n=1 Tax=Nocardia amikacinitolerans TaxID=756689 RepID=UPI000835F417|nr:hypothetical protein [Nocardia amikacinitolerans]